MEPTRRPTPLEPEATTFSAREWAGTILMNLVMLVVALLVLGVTAGILQAHSG